MRLRVVICILIFAAGFIPNYGQVEIPPDGNKIGRTVASPSISGWQMPPVGSLREYAIDLDNSVKRRGNRSVSLNALLPNPSSPGHTILIQYIDAARYRGKRVRFSAFLKSERVDSANLLLRMDGPGMVVVNQDHMQSRLLTGTVDWTKHEIVLDVPVDSMQLVIGFRLVGGGHLWADDASFEIVDPSVPLTGEHSPEQVRAGTAAFIEKYKLSHPTAFENQMTAFHKRQKAILTSPQNLDFEN